MPDSKARTVFVVSDSTGETAMRALSVALEQFPGVPVDRQVLAQVRTPAEIARAVHAARESNGLLLFTLADEHLRQTAHTAAEKEKVLAVDLLDTLLQKLEVLLQVEPIQIPGHPYDPMYFDRIKAYDFATKHDDGKNPDGLLVADVVIIGLSRSGKTPLCRMLAEHRICAGNVPVVRVDALPEQLYAVERERVYALVMQPQRLSELRASRMDREGTHLPDYIDVDAIREEVRMFNQLVARHPGWTKMDVTRLGVEEAAATIRRQHEKRFPPTAK